jgi:hypothetical protein
MKMRANSIAAVFAIAVAGACELAPDGSQPCGGALPASCPDGQVCEDDPDDDCVPTLRGACPGLCQSNDCGGPFKLGCDDWQVCVDVAGDGCDPGAGDRDCAGQCVDDTPVSSGCERPGRDFVAKDPDLCGVIQFLCAPDYVPFYNACGCGCELMAP